MRRGLSLVLGVACIALAPPFAWATTMRKMEMAELVAHAELAVHGRVIATEVVYDESPNGPANVQTITTIEVTQSLKGNAVQTVKVAGFGGRVGDYIYQWPGVPQFEVGEETIVMLSKPAPDQGNKKSLFAPLGRGDHMMVAGLEQGRFKITVDAQGQKVAIQKSEGARFVDEAGKSAEKKPRLMKDVVSEIQAIVQAQQAQAQQIKNEEGGK